MRYDLENAAPLCNNCHFRHHIKGDPTIHEAIGRVWGKKRLDYLNKARDELVKVNVEFYESAIKQLEELEQ